MLYQSNHHSSAQSGAKHKLLLYLLYLIEVHLIILDYIIIIINLKKWGLLHNVYIIIQLDMNIELSFISGSRYKISRYNYLYDTNPITVKITFYLTIILNSEDWLGLVI